MWNETITADGAKIVPNSRFAAHSRISSPQPLNYVCMAAIFSNRMKAKTISSLFAPRVARIERIVWRMCASSLPQPTLDALLLTVANNKNGWTDKQCVSSMYTFSLCTVLWLFMCAKMMKIESDARHKVAGIESASLEKCGDGPVANAASSASAIIGKH